MPSSGAMPRHAPGAHPACPSLLQCPQVAQKCNKYKGCCRGMVSIDQGNNMIGRFIPVVLIIPSTISSIVRPWQGGGSGTSSP